MRADNAEHNDESAEGLRIAVVASAFNASITKGLTAGAVDWLETANAHEVFVVQAPGAFELPLVAQRLASMGYDAVICLGAVVEGDTDHYEHVAHRTSEGLMRVQLDTGIPVSFGVLVVTEREHAIERSKPGSGNKGMEAAKAGVAAANTLRRLGPK
ncbi:MAG: 6,7-dimethyl-8-ribityllumazine synthase [Actinomycetota bacterium]|nr:6,7-dimethyl-8-ribityllumazine synthase [Actinomycetota bacterium]